MLSMWGMASGGVRDTDEHGRQRRSALSDLLAEWARLQQVPEFPARPIPEQGDFTQQEMYDLMFPEPGAESGLTRAQIYARNTGRFANVIIVRGSYIETNEAPIETIQERTTTLTVG